MLKKIASNTIAQILSKVGTAIISIFLISILTNYLTVELYGLYLKVYNYIGIFVFLADLWLYTIAIREISANKKNTKKIVWNVMSLRTILAFIIFWSALGIAYFLPGYNDPLALWSIGIVCVFTLFQLINSSILTLMQANMKIEYSLFSAIVWKIINVLLVAWIALFWFTENPSQWEYFEPFLWIIWASVVAIFINTLLNYFYAKKIENFWFEFDWEYIKYIIKISLPYGIALFLSIVYFKVDIILLSLLDPAWDKSVALYSLPMKIVEVIMVLWGFYLNSVLPSLTQKYEKSDLQWVNKLLDISFRVLFSAGLLIFVLGVLFRDSMIEIIANRDYLDTTHMFNSSDAFLVVFAVVLFHFISLVFIYTLIATKNQSQLLRINIIVTVFNIVWNILLIPHLSFIWAGIVTFLSQIILMWLWYYYSRQYVHFHFSIKFILSNIFFSLWAFIVGYCLIKNFHLWLYSDLLLYGWFIFAVYMGFFYFSFRDIIQKKRLES